VLHLVSGKCEIYGIQITLFLFIKLSWLFKYRLPQATKVTATSENSIIVDHISIDEGLSNSNGM
jgi:hypothetical protein